MASSIDTIIENFERDHQVNIQVCVNEALFAKGYIVRMSRPNSKKAQIGHVDDFPVDPHFFEQLLYDLHFKLVEEELGKGVRYD
jgi:hypothetical protein